MIVMCLLCVSQRASSSDHNDMDMIEDTLILHAGENGVDTSGDRSKGNGESESLIKTPLYTPPTHFRITSHVQTNLATGISYFLPPDALENSYANIPFLECGAIGGR